MSGTTVSYDNATYATQSYVTTAVANLVNSAPSTLDTLNELATALGNDANFSTTVTTSIATKQPQLSGTGFVKISGTTISYDNSTYLTTASASSTYLPLAGGTLTGALGISTATGVNLTYLLTPSGWNGAKHRFGVPVSGDTSILSFNWDGSARDYAGYGSSVIGLSDGTITFGVGSGANPTTRLIIASTGTSTFSGQVRFGTGLYIDTNGDFYQPFTGQIQISGVAANTTYPSYGFYGNTGIGMYRESADTLAFVTSATKRLTISPTGGITVGNAIAATNVEFNLSGVSGKAKRIQFQDGVTGQWLLGQGAASETSAFELYNATGTIVLSVNKTTNISTFNGSTTFAAKTNGNNISLSSNGTAMEMYNTSGTVRNWQISSQVVNSMCLDITPSTANGGTTYSTPVLTIDGEQNRVGVGTGTSRPLTLFHTYSATDNLSTFQAGSSSYGVQLRFRHGSALTGFINSNTTNIFSIYNTNSTEVLSVTPGGDVFHYGATSNQGLWTHVQVGSTSGQSSFNFDVEVGNEGGGGNIFKVEAAFAHYSGMSYNCLAEFYISTRQTGASTTDVVRVDTAMGGSFTASKPNDSTLRVTKNAGNYPGGGRYWIRVTKVTY